MAYPEPAGSRSFVGTGAELSTEPETEWSPGLDENDLQELREAEKDASKIVFKLPSEATRLGYFSALCLIANRMIGEIHSSFG